MKHRLLAWLLRDARAIRCADDSTLLLLSLAEAMLAYRTLEIESEKDSSLPRPLEISAVRLARATLD